MTTNRGLAKIAFEKALYAAWAASWKAYVAANEDAVESLGIATQRAESAMADAKAALAAAVLPGLEALV